jgi:polysaccharide deacetylase family protein (PEP-CTERM system associated)
MTVANALTFDVEEWFHANSLRRTVESCNQHFESRVRQQTERVLSILDEFNVKATFFVLGQVAQEHPKVVAEITERGHEVGSHGFNHRLLNEQTPDEFEADASKSLAVIEGACKVKPLGFRAPNFSMTGDTLWAFPIIKKLGFYYDSSVYPTHLLHKNPVTCPQQPYRTEEGLLEFPGSTTTILGLRIPYGGGVFLRTQPYSFTKKSIQRANENGNPALIYVHPWELDITHPRIPCSIKAKVIHYARLSKTEDILRRLLTDFEFKPLKEITQLHA